MIVRVQFVEWGTGKKKVIHNWSLFSVDEKNDLKQIFDDIYDKKISCGREINLAEYNKEEIYVSSLTSTDKCPTDMMPTSLNLSLFDIRDNNIGSLYILYELKPLDNTVSGHGDDVTMSVHEPIDSITNALMNRFDHYVSPTSMANTGDVKQYNALINFVRERKFGVRGSTVEDFRDFLLLFASLFWEVDPHSAKICNHGGGRFPNEIETLLGFNVPKTHKHAVKSIKIESLKSKVSLLVIKLERKYTSHRHMKAFGDLVSAVCDRVSKYASYLENQKAKVYENSHRLYDRNEEDSFIEDFSVTKLKQVTGRSYFSQLGAVKNLVDAADVYAPININENVSTMDRRLFFSLMKSIVDDGFPVIHKDVYYFRLSSQGPHPAVHFIWKAVKDDANVEKENTKLVVHLREKRKSFYSRASKNIIKNMLHRIGIVKPYKAEYIIKTLLGDASAPVNDTAASISARFNRNIQLGEDIIQDLRENNGAISKFYGFWDIVEKYIDDKTAVDDRRHCSSSGDDIVVNMAHGLLIEDGPICHIVKLLISMIRPFSLVNNSHITLYPQLEIIWKVSKSLRKYWGKYGQISFYIISCITRDCIIVENIFLV